MGAGMHGTVKSWKPEIGPHGYRTSVCPFLGPWPRVGLPHSQKRGPIRERRGGR